MSCHPPKLSRERWVYSLHRNAGLIKTEKHACNPGKGRCGQSPDGMWTWSTRISMEENCRCTTEIYHSRRTAKNKSLAFYFFRTNARLKEHTTYTIKMATVRNILQSPQVKATIWPQHNSHMSQSLSAPALSMAVLQNLQGWRRPNIRSSLNCVTQTSRNK